MTQNIEKIVLIRHGRSAHVHAGWIDLAGFHRWREAYEAAGVISGEVPPPELAALAKNAGALVASTAPRAIDSARLLAPRREPLTSPLLRELDLVPAAVPLRMPLIGWAFAVGARYLHRAVTSQPRLTPEESERIAAAARWLGTLARQHGEVLVVTHHSFRTELAKLLLAEGWQAAEPRRRSSHWSAWSFSRRR
ncbi:MAG TPA: hypothetical protein VGF48_10215 [Thermoanaerobaculia bacterium]